MNITNKHVFQVDNFIDTCDSGSSNGSSVSSVCSLSDLEVGGEEEQKEDKENAYHAIFSGSASCSDGKSLVSVSTTFIMYCVE